MKCLRFQFKAMGGPAELMCCADQEIQARTWFSIVQNELARIEKKYSRYLPSSLLNRINLAAGKAWVRIDAETQYLFRIAAELHAQSDGLFDITSGVLRRVWKFSPLKAEDSTKGHAICFDQFNDHITSLKELIGFEKLEFKDKQVRLPIKGMEIDFGGFGKEYATDSAIDRISEAGFKHGYLNLAGDFRFAGPKPDGSVWQIGIQHPRQASEMLAVIPMVKGGLASSGDYERYFEVDGSRYCHILNPKTGWPVKGLQCVSVVAPNCLVAGCQATIAMLRQDEGLVHLQNLGLPFLCRDASGNIHSRNT